MDDVKMEVPVEFPKELGLWVDDAVELAMVNNYRALRSSMKGDPAIISTTDRLSFQYLAEHCYTEGFAAGYASGSGLERIPDAPKEKD